MMTNVTNEIMCVGAIYSQPSLLVEYSNYIKSKYDFSDEATKFFYDCAEIIYTKRSQNFNKTVVTTFMSENQDRLSTYNKYGGYSTIEKWQNLVAINDFKNYFEVLKKYSLLREYERDGYNIEPIVSHPKFDKLTAEDIYKIIRAKVDRIQTVILSNSDVEILNNDMKLLVNSRLITPDFGELTPFPIINELFRGLKMETMLAVGMLSNAGKSRFMFKLIAYLTLVRKQQVYVMLNEMTIEKMKMCLLTTVVNNAEFKVLHGIDINKKEKELALGLFHDDNGKFLYRKSENGIYLETESEYQERILDLSSEYRNIIKVANWIENETKGLIFAEDVSTAYDDMSLEYKIKKIALTKNIKYYFYDTLKQDVNVMNDWSALKATTTKLSELTRELKCFVYASIQLTDEAIACSPDRLTSQQIANAKQLKHVLDNLILAKEIDKSEYKKYKYLAHLNDWGEPTFQDLDERKRYYIFNIDKNRDGEKKKLLFSIDLNTNEWYEVGEVFRKVTG